MESVLRPFHPARASILGAGQPGQAPQPATGRPERPPARAPAADGFETSHMSELSHVSNADPRNGLSMAVARIALDEAKFQGAVQNALIEDAKDVAESSSRGAVSASPGPGETGNVFDATV